VNGTITASNKGGYTVEISGIRAFCPISQIDANYVNDPEIYVGQSFDFLITEFKESGRNVVVSRKRLLEDERRQAENRLVETISPGAIVEGVVTATIRHGALVDLSGVEGFVPMAELARARVENAADVVTIGEKVRAQVLSVERGEKGLSIRLSLRALKTDSDEEEKLAPAKDEILEGKVVKHTGNGLIVATSKGEGLVPTRELSLAPGADHRRTYPVDTDLSVVVVSRDSRSGKVRFSVQKVAQVEERNNSREFHKGNDQQDSSSTMGSLGELMAKKFPGLTQEAARSAPKPAITRETPPPIAKPQPAASTMEKPLEKSAPFKAQGETQAHSASSRAQPTPQERDGIKRRRK
jgi:small subunit ribosomal protein S1